MALLSYLFSLRAMATRFSSAAVCAKVITIKMATMAKSLVVQLPKYFRTRPKKGTNAKSVLPTAVVPMAKPVSTTSTASVNVYRHTVNNGDLRKQLRELAMRIALAEDRAFSTTSFIVVIHQSGLASCTEMAMTDDDKERAFGRLGPLKIKAANDVPSTPWRSPR